MYPDPNVGPLWEIPFFKPFVCRFKLGFDPQESINTMGTLLGVHPIVP